MEVNRRSFVMGSVGSLLAASAGCAAPRCGAAAGRGGAESFALGPNGRLGIAVPGLVEGLRAFVVGDTHLGLFDERDAAYADNYARMAKYSPKERTAAFERTLAKAKEAKADIVLLAGDIISYPTLANVEFVAAALEKSGVEWMYTAGNHDWHFEGVDGSDAEQRAEWTRRRLMPLYRGGAPLMSSRVVKGVRFVAIDNSIYHITKEQLAFWESEAAKGEPVVLFMHIPLWTPEFGLTTCGNPEWGAATDPYWKIERRARWAERQSPETFAFREAVLSAPNLVAVFSGHEHQTLAATERGKFLLSVPWNANGAHFDVALKPLRNFV